MSTTTKQFICALAALVSAAAASLAQEAGIRPPVVSKGAAATPSPAPNSDLAPMTVVQASSSAANPPATATPGASQSTTTQTTTTTTTATDNGGVGVREFQGDDV